VRGSHRHAARPVGVVDEAVGAVADQPLAVGEAREEGRLDVALAPAAVFAPGVVTEALADVARQEVSLARAPRAAQRVAALADADGGARVERRSGALEVFAGAVLRRVKVAVGRLAGHE